MVYKCSKCDYTSEKAGNCPTCNVPMTEEKGENASSKSTETENQ